MDKQELRQDPIREKIIGSLSYLENNRNALFGVLAIIVLIIGVSGYYSSSSKALQVESASDLGVALITFTNDKGNLVVANDDGSAFIIAPKCFD